jgi:DNA (cytosine-5)-methyltransferase 1
MKILNLYAGIGGNRKLWGDEHEITAVEYVPEIAKIYADFFPNDKVIVADAHQYVLDHFAEFDFIWSSPPCPSHSKIRRYTSVEKGQVLPVFPDMKLLVYFLPSHRE